MSWVVALAGGNCSTLGRRAAAALAGSSKLPLEFRCGIEHRAGTEHRQTIEHIGHRARRHRQTIEQKAEHPSRLKLLAPQDAQVQPPVSVSALQAALANWVRRL